MELVLRGLTWKMCLVYVDDVIVIGRTFKEHLQKEILQRFKNVHLKLNMNRYSHFQKLVTFFGHNILSKGIETGAQKVSAVQNRQKSSSKSEVQSFLGFCTCYCTFVESFADTVKSLHRMTEDKSIVV